MNRRAAFNDEFAGWVRCLFVLAIAATCSSFYMEARCESTSEFLDRCQRLADGGKQSESVALLDGFIAKNKDVALAYRTRGNALLHMQKMQEALDDYNRALKILPSDEVAYLLRGELFVLTGRPQQALADEDVVLRSPASPIRQRALFLKAHALYGLKRYDEALECLRQSVKIRGKENNHDHMLVSLIAIKQNRVADALRASNAAITTAPKNPDGYLQRASCYALLKEEKRMFRDCDQAISLDPSGANTYISSSNLAAEIGRPDRQTEYLSRALRIVPNDIGTNLRLAEVLMRQRKTDDSLRYAEKVIELAPNLDRAYFLRGHAKFQKQDYNGAIKDADKILANDPKNEAGLYLAHITNFKLGKWDEALRQIEKRMEYAPTSRGDALIHKAIIFIAKGKYEQALGVLQNGEMEGCSRKELCLQRVHAYEKLQRMGKARAEFSRAIRESPNDASLLMEYASFKWRLDRDNPEIVADCDRVIKVDPSLLFAHIIKASYLVHVRKPLEALPSIEKALNLDNRHGGVYQIKGKAYNQLHRPYDQTLALFRKGRELGSDDVDCSYHIAELMLSNGHPDKALVEIDAAIVRNPNVPSLHRMRSLCLRKLGKHQAAVLSAMKSNQIEPSRAVGRLAVILLKSGGSYQRAIKELSTLITAQPDDAQLLVDRASCYRQQKKTTEALLDLTRAVKLDPSCFTAYFERANLYRDLLKSERALTDARRALALKPRETIPRLFIAEILFEKKEFKEVVEQLSLFLEQRPANMEATLLRGKAYSQLNSSELALEDYNHILEFDSKHLGARRARMSELLRLERYDEVVKESDKVIALDKNNYRVLEMRAEAEEELGRLKEAVDDYSKAIELTAQVGALFQRRANVYDRLGRADLAKQDRQKLNAVSPVLNEFK